MRRNACMLSSAVFFSLLLQSFVGRASSFHIRIVSACHERMLMPIHPVPVQQSLIFAANRRSDTTLHIFRKRGSSEEGSTTTESGSKNKKLSPRQLRKLANHPLHQAGQTFVAASVQSMGMLFYNVGGMEHKEIQSELLEAGNHLVAASKTWDSDWKATRHNLGDAARVFDDIANTFGSAQIDDAESLATLFEAVGLELQDMSRIEKRRKTSPNLFSVRDHLLSVAEILQENSVAETDDHDMITSFVGVSDSFGRLAERYS
mmetsp:Transcript_3824/g.8356  ORF Transcript_3824/g.8356 Transcript_3824/m.8356 type:complete len:261 (+) Transcript_3824:87-869(+)